MADPTVGHLLAPHAVSRAAMAEPASTLPAHGRTPPRPSTVTLQAWGAAALIVAGSLLLGHALGLLGFRARAASPAVGLAALMVITSIAITLPGRAVTSVIITLLVLVAAAVLAVMRRDRWRVYWTPVAVVLLTGFGAAIPFLSTGRVGLPGVALDNDMASHLEYAEALRSSVTRAIYGLPSAYPLGPHSLAATLATGLGAQLDLAFTGLLIGTVIVTGLTAAGAFRGQAGVKRVIAGGVAALLYLVAAYYAEAAFKEQLLGLFLLAMALHLEEVRAGPRLRSWGVLRALVPAAIMCAAAVGVYGYLALAWIGLTIVLWLAAETVTTPGRLRRWRRELGDLGPGVIGAGVVFILLLAPIAGRVLSLFNTFGVSPSGNGAITTSMLGNLVGALSPLEALGIWHSNDYRFPPPDLLHAGILGGLALGVLVFGMVWALTRREFLLPAAVTACAFIWWRSSHTQSIYVTAKALVIAGPVVAVTGLRALLSVPRVPLRPSAALSRLAIAVIFVFFAARSSYQVLANEPVWPSESTKELLALDRLTRGHTVLFLGATDFTDWLFHDSRMSALAPNSGSLGQAALRPSKPNVYGTALDFDSADSGSLNHFDYVITSTTQYASQPPAAFRLARRLPLYELWKRTGTVLPRQALDPPGAPGAVLNCRTPTGRRLRRDRGVADVMVAPVVGPGTGILAGATVHVPVTVPAGRWQLSLQYTSALDLQVSEGGRRWGMPAYQDRPGPVFQVGPVTSTGAPLVVTIGTRRPSSLTGSAQTSSVTAVIFTRIPDIRQIIPLARSCGRYVDWYRLDAPSG